MKNDELLARPEAAKILGVKENTLAVWASTKRYNLPVIKIGRLSKYRRSDIEAFIADNVVGGPRMLPSKDGLI